MAINKSSYNKYDAFPLLAYNCVSYLLENNELIWRLLKYTDRDAWKLDSDHPNLTKEEKGALIYSGQANDADFRVFLSPGPPDTSITQEVAILRISPLTVIPSNYVAGKVTIALEIWVHFKINTLSNYQNRTDMIIQQLLEELNGQEVGGIGKLYFGEGSRNRIITSGRAPLKSRILTMTNWEAS